MDGYKQKIEILIILFILIPSIIPVISGQSKSTTKMETKNSSALIKLSDRTDGVSKNGIYSSVNPTQNVSVFISLKLRNEGLLNYVLTQLQNSSSTLYHQYLTKNEIKQLFSPNITEYKELISFFSSRGFKVNSYYNRMIINLIGSFSQYEETFHTTIGMYNSGNYSYYAPVKSLYINKSFAGDITGITGLNNNSLIISSDVLSTQSPQNAVNAPDIQNAYNLSKLYSLSNYPSGETIAIIGFSGIDFNHHAVSPYIKSDISTYFSLLKDGQPTPTLNYHGVKDGSGQLPPIPASSGTLNDISGNSQENTLDIEMAGSMAPGSNITFIYQNEGTLSTDTDRMLTYALNKLNNLAVISTSHIGIDQTDTTLQTLEQQAALEGITLVAASGDSQYGISLNKNSLYTASYPSSVCNNTSGFLSVGGINPIFTYNNGIINGFSSKSTAWNSSQGGPSGFNNKPNWQTNSVDVSNVIRSLSDSQQGERVTPDIAGPASSINIFFNGSYFSNVTGTSFAAPLTAGVIASMDQFLKERSDGPEGFMNPEIYAIGQTQYSAGTPLPFVDITVGSNPTTKFDALRGYDLVTGWGVLAPYNYLEAQYSNLPDIYNYNPVPNQTETSSFTFIAQAKTSVGLQKIQLYMDSNLLKTCQYTPYTTDNYNNACTYSFSVTDTSNNGQHNYYIHAYDDFGRENTMSIPFTIDYYTPTRGGGCVAQNTLILMADGTTRKVQSLKVGDILEGYDYQTHNLTSVELYNITETSVNQLLVINNGLLKLTPTDQPIYMRNATYTGWLINPQDLKVGDQIFSPTTGSWITITSLTYEIGNFKVYDVRTTPFNNFIANGILLDIKVQ